MIRTKSLDGNCPPAWFAQTLMSSREAVRPAENEVGSLPVVSSGTFHWANQYMLLGVAMVEITETICWPIRALSYCQTYGTAIGSAFIRRSLMEGGGVGAGAAKVCDFGWYLSVTEEGLEFANDWRWRVSNGKDAKGTYRLVVFAGDQKEHGLNICGYVEADGGTISWRDVAACVRQGAASVRWNGALMLGERLLTVRVGEKDVTEEIYVPPHFNVLGWHGLLAIVNWGGRNREVEWISKPKRKRLDIEALREWDLFLTKKSREGAAGAKGGRVARVVDERALVESGEILPACPLAFNPVYTGGFYSVLRKADRKPERDLNVAGRSNIVAFGMAGRSVVVSVHREIHGVDTYLEVETCFSRGVVYGGIKAKNQKGNLVICGGCPTVVGLGGGGGGVFSFMETEDFCRGATKLRCVLDDLEGAGAGGLLGPGVHLPIAAEVEAWERVLAREQCRMPELPALPEVFDPVPNVLEWL